MPGQSARDTLLAKRKELKSELEDVGASAGLVGILMGMVALIMGYMGIVTVLGLGPYLEKPPYSWVHTAVIITLALAGLFVPMLLTPRWLENIWRRRYRRVWRWLRYSDAPKFVMEQELWERVFDIIDQRAWLKLTGVRKPNSLDEQIELASDYWPAIEAMLRGDSRRLSWLVTWCSLSRLSDTAVVFIFNGCMVFVLLFVTGILLFTPLIPLFFVMLPQYARRQGAQQALVDWLLGKHVSWLGKIEPLPKPGRR